MGQEFLRKSGMRNQETQTELNEPGNSNFKLKRLRKVRTKEATRDQMNSESVLSMTSGCIFTTLHFLCNL